MNGKRKSGMFVGFQVKSEYHDLKTIKEAINKVKERVERKSNVNINVQYGIFPAGNFLFNEVFSAVKNCEITIFDISENNPNVMIEVGLAYGNNKRVILLKNNLSKKKYKVPSDIEPFIYIPYKNKEAVSSNTTCDEIANAMVHYYKEISTSLIYPKALWGFNESEHVYIVLPELEKPQKRQEPEPEEFLYLGKYGDIDALFAILTSLNKLYPQLNITYCTSEEFGQISGNPFADNLILVGGPDYNKITKYFMKDSPFQFIEQNTTTIMKDKAKKIIYKSNLVKSKGVEEFTDYGFFLKIPNPNNKNKKLIMVNGIHTYGVYGTAKCFSLYDDHEKEIVQNNCKKVVDKFGNDPNFTIVVKVKAINKKVVIPEIKQDELIPL